MSDRERGDSGAGSTDMDFSGLLPGDEQPRRRRRRAPVQRSPGEQEQATQTLGNHGDVGSVGEESSAPERSPEPEGDGSEEAPLGPEPPAEEPRLEGAGQTQDVAAATESSPPDPGSSATPPAYGSAVPEAGVTPLPDEASPNPAPAGIGVEQARSGEREATTGESEDMSAARRAAREVQAALIEGQDLDRILGGISALSPEQRSAYKSSIALSEEHYELLADLRKEFRRRGFAGNDATISNMIALGLEVVHETLKAEKNLPRP